MHVLHFHCYFYSERSGRLLHRKVLRLRDSYLAEEFAHTPLMPENANLFLLTVLLFSREQHTKKNTDQSTTTRIAIENTISHEAHHLSPQYPLNRRLVRADFGDD